jgi:hypothetical protein
LRGPARPATLSRSAHSGTASSRLTCDPPARAGAGEYSATGTPAGGATTVGTGTQMESPRVLRGDAWQLPRCSGAPSRRKSARRRAYIRERRWSGARCRGLYIPSRAGSPREGQAGLERKSQWSPSIMASLHTSATFTLPHVRRQVRCDHRPNQ